MYEDTFYDIFKPISIFFIIVSLYAIKVSYFGIIVIWYFTNKNAFLYLFIGYFLCYFGVKCFSSKIGRRITKSKFILSNGRCFCQINLCLISSLTHERSFVARSYLSLHIFNKMGAILKLLRYQLQRLYE